MIHEITPYIFSNAYIQQKPNSNDYVICFENGKIYLTMLETAVFSLPTVQECFDNEQDWLNYKYLFCVNDRAFFLAQHLSKTGNIKTIDIEEAIFSLSKHLRYAVTIALQLHNWYYENKYCGCCGTLMKENTTERKLECPHCKNMVYPKICPVIMVGIYHEDYLLVTKYTNREYAGYSLVAGFVEIGETLEEAVKREVKEEVGISVDDITYFNSQPWGSRPH